MPAVEYRTEQHHQGDHREGSAVRPVLVQAEQVDHRRHKHDSAADAQQAAQYADTKPHDDQGNDSQSLDSLQIDSCLLQLIALSRP